MFKSRIAAKLMLYISTALLAAIPSAVLAQSMPVVSYIIENHSVTITGNLTPSDEALVAAFAVYTGEEANFGENNLPLFAKITEVEEDGLINCSIPLDTKLSSGKYTAYFSRRDIGHFASDFMILNPYDTDSLGAIEKLNSAQTKESFINIFKEKGETIGIDIASLSETQLNFIATSAYALRTENYTVQDFYRTYNGLLAATLIKNGDIDKAMSKYASGFCIEYNDYAALSQNCKKELASLLRDASYSDAKPHEIYADCLLTASVKTAESWSSMRDMVLNSADSLGIDTGKDSKYNKLSIDSKQLVFIEMYKTRNKFQSTNDIKKEFDEQIILQSRADSNTKNNSGGSGSGSGGGSGSSGFVNTSDYDILKPQNNAQNNSGTDINFPDIVSHFSESHVRDLAKKGIVNGFPDGCFKPDRSVTRAEFAKMTCLAFGISGGEGSVFYDVQPDAWYAPVVASLAHNNIIMGYNGYFRPDDGITREDAAVIVNRVITFSAESNISQYSDASDISDYAADAVGILSGAGILNGNNGRFYPKNAITRGETAVLLNRVLKYISSGGSQ